MANETWAKKALGACRLLRSPDVSARVAASIIADEALRLYAEATKPAEPDPAEVGVRESMECVSASCPWWNYNEGGLLAHRAAHVRAAYAAVESKPAEPDIPQAMACSRCYGPWTEPGALLLSPPYLDRGGSCVTKLHLCPKCYHEAAAGTKIAKPAEPDPAAVAAKCIARGGKYYCFDGAVDAAGLAELTVDIRAAYAATLAKHEADREEWNNRKVGVSIALAALERCGTPDARAIAYDLRRAFGWDEEAG